MKSILFILFTFVSFLSFSENDKIVKITGIAPGYVGENIEVYKIQDYFSMKEELIASSQVKEDSTFQLYFYNDITQKVVIRSKKNKAFLYIEPNGVYDVFLPAEDPYDSYRPSGGTVELAFFSLDSTDVNYKILGFERWIDDFLGAYFYTKNIDGIQFSKELETFKTNIEKAYKNDTSVFFKTFVKFSVASLDDIQQVGARNRFEKHDFHIKYSPVSYENDAYMEYIKNYYKNFVSRLSLEVNNRVYLGVLNSSPTQVMRALGGEYTLINIRIREMMMVKMLTDVYYNGDFPQTNIVTILDSVSNYAMFENTKIISKNLKDRLLELVPGGKSPDFLLTKEGEVKTLFSYSKKYIYMHFFDPENITSLTEIQLLNSLHKKYGQDIQFISVYLQKDSISSQSKEIMKDITWDLYKVDKDNTIYKDFQIYSSPSYVLIDQYGYIVASPALGPRPNGQGVSIEKSFFYIQKNIQETKK